MPPPNKQDVYNIVRAQTALILSLCDITIRMAAGYLKGVMGNKLDYVLVPHLS